ncbi:MAG: WD40 repeat domain-containing protein [Myxococcales bacterium]|nr:WD40 repeat domain-containing protein [Myxococcales bacterium]
MNKRLFAAFILTLLLSTSLFFTSCGDDDDNDDSNDNETDDDNDDNDDNGEAYAVIDADNASQVQLLQELSGHTGGIYTLGWSPDGAYLATAGADRDIRVWDAIAWTATVLTGHTGSVWGVSWSPDGARLASVDLDGNFYLWDIASAALNQNLTLEESAAYAVAWSLDGDTIAVGRIDGWISLFDVESGSFTDEFASNTTGGLSTEIISLRFSPDGATLASGGINYAIVLWNTANWEQLAEIRADTTARNDINGLAWSNDGQLLAAAGQDSYLRLWNTSTYTETLRMKHGDSWTRGIAWSLGNDVLVATGEIFPVDLFDAQSGAVLAQLTGHTSPVWAVDLSPDGRLVATGGGLYESTGGDTIVRIWGVPQN